MIARHELSGLVVVLALSGLFYGASFTYSIGHAIDDGIHIVTAKSMADGLGLRLISDPESPVSTQFPPALSLLLVPVLWMYPDVPDNIIPLKVIPAVCALLFIFVSWLWFRRYFKPNLALGLAALVAINPETVRFAGSVIAEMGYAFASILALICFEKTEDQETGRIRSKYLVFTILAITLAYLFRSVGIALVLAGVASMVWSRRWNGAIILLVGFLICAAPWLMKGALVGTPEYQEQFWLADLEDPEKGTIGPLGLVDRALINVPTYFLTAIPYHILPPLGGQRVIAFSESLYLWPLMIMLQVGISILILVGFLARIRRTIGYVDVYMVVYFGILMVWHTRLQWKYLAPITPILLLYLVVGTQSVCQYLPRVRKISHRLPAAAVVLLFVAAAVRSNDYLQSGWLISGKVDPYAKTYQWIRESTQQDSRLMGFDHLALYLYTDRKAVAAAMSHRPDAVMDYIIESRTDYFVTGRTVVKGSGPSLDEKYLTLVLEAYPEAFSLAYRDPESLLTVYRVDRSIGDSP